DVSIGSQGYRTVLPDNRIVTGDETLGNFHGLFEYTPLGDGLYVGHAAYDGGGVQVWDDVRGVLLQVELSDTVFVVANREGEAVALAYQTPKGVAFVQTTMAELRALSPVVTPPKPPKPPDPPKPPPPVPPLPPVPPVPPVPPQPPVPP